MISFNTQLAYRNQFPEISLAEIQDKRILKITIHEKKSSVKNLRFIQYKHAFTVITLKNSKNFILDCRGSKFGKFTIEYKKVGRSFRRDCHRIFIKKFHHEKIYCNQLITQLKQIYANKIYTVFGNNTYHLCIQVLKILNQSYKNQQINILSKLSKHVRINTKQKLITNQQQLAEILQNFSQEQLEKFLDSQG